MTLKPANAAELTQLLSEAFKQKEKVGAIDLSALNRVVAHTPQDMTVTVEAGMTLAALQTELARRQQWLPIDPPEPDRLTFGDLINGNASGPRRFGYGTIRDYLIGIRVALADGTIINSGGKVVKNVAGYDLGKLFIGSHGSLGVVLETTFKLRPLPELERCVHAQFDSLEKAARLLESVMESELTPVVLDLHRLSASGAAPLTVAAGFAGCREEVEWQLERVAALGVTEAGSLDYDSVFRGGSTAPQRWSVLPSRLRTAIGELNGAPFVARAGNGIVYHIGPAKARKPPPLELMRRVKDAFDPAHILPEPPL
jgi:FAD/FMN-containing dehydrogenase